jgi:uncharacterized protein (TIGR03437 family)
MRHARAFALVLLVTSAAAGADSGEILTRIQSLNVRARSGVATIAEQSDRRSLVAQLMRADPRAVEQIAQEPDEISGEWTGHLEVIAEMDFKQHTASTHYYLRLSSERIELFGEPQDFGGTQGSGDRMVSAAGIRAGSDVAISHLDLTPVPHASLSSGAQKIAVVMVTTPANPAFPSAWTPAAVDNLFFGTTGVTLNTFWQEASYGQTSASGKVFGPFALTSDFGCSSTDGSSDAIRKAAIAAAQGVDFTAYNRLAIVFPVKTCSYGGLASIGTSSYSELPQAYSIAWFPVTSFETPTSYVQIAAHEGGHNLGLNHANTDTFSSQPLGATDDQGTDTEYGDIYSAMGVGEGGSGSLTFGQYAAPHKAEVLGWLDQSSFQEVTASGTFTIVPLENTTGLRGLRVLRDAKTQTWLWIEARRPLGIIDTTLSNLKASNVFSGALVHYENPQLDPLHTYLLNFGPKGGPAETAALTEGQSWTDPYSLLTLRVLSAGASGVTVAVIYEAPCATFTLTGGLIPAAGGSGTVDVAAPASCNWTASTTPTWLTLGGTLSGSGNGKFTFTASANAATAQRSAVVNVQRQGLPVIQEGTGLTGIGVTPNAGSGADATFAFQFASSKGYANLDFVNGVVGSSPYDYQNACNFSVATAGYIWLYDDSGTNKALGPVFLNKAGTSISNGSCTVLADGSSLQGSGDILTATVHVQFKDTLAGSHAVYGWAHNSGGFQGPWKFGAWTVPSSNTTSIQSALSAASYAAGKLAPESIAALFGKQLATSTAIATTVPLPLSLGGTSLSVKDSAGVTRSAPLYFVSATQINFEVPPGTAAGAATITVNGPGGATASLNVTIAASAPGLFLANATSGLAFAATLTVPKTGNPSVDYVYQVDSAGNVTPKEIDLSKGDVYLLLFGTGVRGAKTVTAQVAGLNIPVPFAGAQGAFVGEDQMNVGPLPSIFAGKGTLQVVVFADGVASNTASIRMH